MEQQPVEKSHKKKYFSRNYLGNKPHFYKYKKEDNSEICEKIDTLSIDN